MSPGPRRILQFPQGHCVVVVEGPDLGWIRFLARRLVECKGRARSRVLIMEFSPAPDHQKGRAR